MNQRDHVDDADSESHHRDAIRADAKRFRIIASLPLRNNADERKPKLEFQRLAQMHGERMQRPSAARHPTGHLVHSAQIPIPKGVVPESTGNPDRSERRGELRIVGEETAAQSKDDAMLNRLVQLKLRQGKAARNSLITGGFGKSQFSEGSVAMQSQALKGDAGSIREAMLSSSQINQNETTGRPHKKQLASDASLEAAGVNGVAIDSSSATPIIADISAEGPVPMPVLNELLDYAAVHRNGAGEFEFHIGAGSDRRRSLRVKVTSHGQRRISISIISASDDLGAYRATIDELSEQIHSAGLDIESLEFKVAGA